MRNMLMAAMALTAMCAAAGPGAGRTNALAPIGKPAHPLALAAGGKTTYVIVIPAQPTSQERKAAADLAQWLGEMTGASFPVVPDTTPAVPTEISVGRTTRAAALPQAKADLGEEGYAIATSGKRLFLLGGSRRGPINAVYALLEEDLGCRWYAGESADIPRRRTLTFRPVPRSYRPPFLIRDPFYFDCFNPVWALRNRTNAPGSRVPEEWGGCVDYDGMFVHTFDSLVPRARYFAEHPEYYSLLDGKRNPHQLCLTNPQVLRLVIARVRETLAANPHSEIISVSPNDGGRHCECPACTAIDRENGSPAGSLITFVNAVAEAIAQDHPGVLVSTLAYLDTIDPPRKVRPRPNVAIQLCNDLHAWRYPLIDFANSPYPESKRYREAIIGWAKIARHIHIWDYTVNFSHYLAPMPNLHVLAPSVDFYRRHGVTGVMFQGNYQSLGGERTPMRTWVMAKLLWDPRRRVEALQEDFVQGYYREAAPAIAEYYHLLEAAGRAHGDEITGERGGIRYPMDATFLSHDFLAQAGQVLDRAVALAKSRQIRRRVELERLAVIYAKLSQGPLAWPQEYACLLEEFARVAARENITHLEEGAPDLEVKLGRWREALHAARLTRGVCMPVLNVAHRGASGSAPENTLAAFRLACALPCDQVELDLRHTSDGQWVVLHDDTVDRTTNGKGKLAELTLAQVKELDAGAWFSPEFAGERIPTLAEALAAIPPEIGLNVHVKTVLPGNEAPERELARLLAARGTMAPIYVMCDHPETVRRLRTSNPSLVCGIFGGADWQAYLDRSASLGLTVIQPNRDVLCPELVLAAHRREMRVNVFWADTPRDMRRFIEMGVDGILTNQPAILRRVLAEEE